MNQPQTFSLAGRGCVWPLAALGGAPGSKSPAVSSGNLTPSSQDLLSVLYLFAFGGRRVSPASPSLSRGSGSGGSPKNSGLGTFCTSLNTGLREQWEGFRLPRFSPKARVLCSPRPGEPCLMLWEAKTQDERASQQGLDQTKALLSH